MKIGLYGGSFDPVHFGHLIAAQEVYERFGLDRVIFIPAAQSPLKPSAVHASAADRIAMVQAAIEGDPRFAVSDIELRRGGLSYTLDTVRELRAQSPRDTFYWIIGGDQAARLPQWHAIERLAAVVEFIAVDRPGSGSAATPAALPIPGLRIHRLESRLIDISSTELRERARRGLPLQYFIPHKALVYLKAHCLYRENQAPRYRPMKKESSTLQLVRQICRALDAKKAEALRVSDVRAHSSITDYIIVATGTADTHLRALRVELEKVLDAAGAQILGMDGQRESGWLVVDAFEVMVHLFLGETRQHYRLEQLWQDAPTLDVAELIAEPKAAAKPKPATKKGATPAARKPAVGTAKKAAAKPKAATPTKKKAAPRKSAAVSAEK